MYLRNLSHFFNAGGRFDAQPVPAALRVFVDQIVVLFYGDSAATVSFTNQFVVSEMSGENE